MANSQQMSLYDWIKTDPPMHKKLTVLLHFYQELYKKGDQNKRYRPTRKQIFVVTGNLNVLLAKHLLTSKQAIEQQKYLYQNHLMQIPIMINFLAYMIQGSISKYDDFLRKNPTFKQKDIETYNFMVKHRTKFNEINDNQFQEALRNLIAIHQKKYEQQTKQQNKLSNPPQKQSSALQYLYNVINTIKDNNLQNFSLTTLSQIKEEEHNYDWRIFNAKGVIYQTYGHKETAQKCYKQALIRTKNKEIILNNLSNLYFQAGQNHLYVEKLRELKELNTLDPKIKYYFAFALLNARQYDKALIEFKELIETVSHPENIEHRIRAAEIYYLKEQKEKSKQIYEKIIEDIDKQNSQKNETANRTVRLNLKTPQNRSSKTAQQAERHHVSQSNQKLKQDFKLWKKTAKYNIILINKQLNAVSLDKTVTEIYNLHKQYPESKQFLYLYATTLLENGNYDAALRLYIQVKVEYQNSYEYFWNVSKCLFEGQNEECFIYLNQIKTKDKSRVKFINKTIIEISEYFSKLNAADKNKKQSTLTKNDQTKIRNIIQKAKQQANSQIKLN